MASISKHIAQNGEVSYNFRVFAGNSAAGKKVYKRESWAPPAGMGETKADKEAARRAAEFEERVQKGFAIDKGVTLDALLDRWFEEYAKQHLKSQTVYDYERLRPRVSKALGHMRIDKIRPAHLMQFYSDLSQEGMRQDGKYIATPALCKILNQHTRKAVAQAAGLGENTARLALQGNPVARETAQKLANAAGLAPSKAFRPENPDAKLSTNTVRHYHRFLSSVFSKAVKWQLIPDNPCARVDAPKLEDADIEMLDEHGVAALLEALHDAPPQMSVIIQLALFTGCRRSELCGLRWSDLNFERATLSINRALHQLPGHGAEFDTPKTKRSRRCIKLSSDAVQLLTEWRKAQLEERLKLGTLWAQKVEICGEVVKNDLMFTRWNGEPIDPNSITSWFPVFLSEHGLPPVRFHSLRHTNASLLIAAHVPVVTVSGRLGHAKTSTTTDIYAACIRSSDAEAADALDSVFDRIRHAQKETG